MNRAFLFLIAFSVPLSVLAAPAIIISDGDTISVDGVKVRLVGYDTPETNKALCDDGDRYRERKLGFKATNRLRQLFRERPYEIKWQNRQDRYRREIAHLYFQGWDVAEIMIGEGLAVRYDCPNYRCKARINWCDILR